MQTLSGLASLPEPRLHRPVVTWGVFDGVHRGHRKVLGAVATLARSLRVSAAVVTFDRHPAEVLTGKPVPLLAPLEERLRLLGETGLDFCLVLPFSLEFSKITAEQFVRDAVVGKMRACAVVLGHDSRFGHDRTGDVEFLERLGHELAIEVHHCAPEMDRGRPVSSSLIREAVSAGRLDEAARLLGRPPSVFGTVVRGDRRGSTLGFPTANLDLRHGLRPPSGVYAAAVPLDGRAYRAVVNLGRRPTFTPEGPETLEAHLLDWAGGDLYGKSLEVRFLARVRDERRFESVEALKRQIQADIDFVRHAV